MNQTEIIKQLGEQNIALQKENVGAFDLLRDMAAWIEPRQCDNDGFADCCHCQLTVRLKKLIDLRGDPGRDYVHKNELERVRAEENRRYQELFRKHSQLMQAIESAK